MTARFDNAIDYAVRKMTEDLDGDFKYHNLDHVLDVVRSAERIARSEGVHEAEIELLRIAAYYHDVGYTIGMRDHEKLGCDIAKKVLPDYGYDDNEIGIVCGLIMATRIPQSPVTKLEEIMCDADLDYLGRNDFFEIGDNLYEEFKIYGLLKNRDEWQQMQFDFLTAHRYFTVTARESRDAGKAENLKKVSELLKQQQG